MATTLADWELCVERGPGWLIVKPIPQGTNHSQPYDLAQAIWALLEQHFTYRLLVEMHDVPLLSSHLIGQLILLHKRIHQHGGVLRLCGLSPSSEEALQICQLATRLPNYGTREEAVLGHRPKQPR
jgi:anti-anti-sigma factor